MDRPLKPSPLESEQETLLGHPSPPDPPAAAGPSSSSASSLSGGRFAPGTVLGERYRIVDLLGRGGMGEVYRAEDLKLGETVALKFLPEELSQDGAALARLHRELTLARRITHKNVVRMHDAGDADGIPFLVMEYVDGENLASLLKRIGRLPETKALELARQLCAGLAAAHERGMIHRDLKPANVMIDGEGQAKISDFGLADLATELDKPELAGTIHYMAPEQLAEGRASFASDLYSLGLVLYEMFSGQRPFRGTTRAELQAEHQGAEPSSLSSWLESVDPLVDRAIAQCLEREPRKRPETPLAVAASLPGGDPLAAALAAGETPSPEMVARVAGQAALSKPMASALFATTVVATLAAAWLLGRSSVVELDRPLPPEVLEHTAHQLLAGLGSEGEFSRSWFQFDDYRWLVTRRQGLLHAPLQAELERRPNVLELVYRSSDKPITPTKRWRLRVGDDDPPLATQGISTVRLDSQGNLRALLLPPSRLAPAGTPWSTAVGEQSVSKDAANAPEEAIAVSPEITPGNIAPLEPIDWRPLFEASGLQDEAFSRVAPPRAPPYWAEHLHSWRGAYPDQPTPRLVVDAASVGGSVVWWQVVEEELAVQAPPGTPSAVAIGLVVFALILLLGGWLAYQHLRNGRGDQRGATRLALALAAAHVVSWLLAGHHGKGLSELSLFNSAVATAVLMALAVWVLYMALEPYARRLMPKRLTSWKRVLDGRFDDPLVGRDLLIGLAAASCTLAALTALRGVDGSSVWTYPHGLAPLGGVPVVVSNLLHEMTVLVPISLMAIVVAGRAVVRSDRWAPLAVFLVVLGAGFAETGSATEAALQAAVLTGLGFYVGLLGLIGFGIATVNLELVPVSLDATLWWARASWVGIGTVVLVAVWCFRCATRADSGSPGAS